MLISSGTSPASAQQVQQAYAVLSRPQTAAEAGDVAVTRLASNMRESDAANSGLPPIDPTEARILSTTGGTTVWLMPTTDDSTCLGLEQADGTIGGACQPNSVALAQGMAATVGSTAEIYGVVPDGVSAIQAERPDGSSFTVAVSGNVYTLPLGPVILRFDDASGTQSVSIDE
jgi:hypothetical protein